MTIKIDMKKIFDHINNSGDIVSGIWIYPKFGINVAWGCISSSFQVFKKFGRKR